MQADIKLVRTIAPCYATRTYNSIIHKKCLPSKSGAVLHEDTVVMGLIDIYTTQIAHLNCHELREKIGIIKLVMQKDTSSQLPISRNNEKDEKI